MTHIMNGLDYAVWLEAVDDACWRIDGLSKRDLPDDCLADWYAQGVSPHVVARRAVRIVMGGLKK